MPKSMVQYIDYHSKIDGRCITARVKVKCDLALAPRARSTSVALGSTTMITTILYQPRAMNVRGHSRYRYRNKL
jgi:hypothetical protein